VRGHLWPVVAVIGTLCVAINGGRIGSSMPMNAHFSAERMPVGAVNYIESHGVRGPVLSPDYWGGYVIYRLYPKTQVVADDRHDLYGEDFFKSYLKMMHVEPGWDELLRAHPVSCVLLPKAAPLALFLTATAGWKQIYSDDVATAFVPDSDGQ
jgi:hypothetical protein